MALSLSSPGITIKEVDLTKGSVNATSALSAGIAAPFSRGPVDEATTIRNESELLSLFGAPSKNNYQYEYWYSASNFMSYGGSLRVVRADSANLKNSNAGVSTASADIKVKNYEDYQNSTNTGYYFAAKNPGSWSEGVRVCVIDNFADQTISGVSTSGLSVGVGVTQTLSTGGYLKGIICGVGNSSIYVKVTNKVVSETETPQDYTEKGVYAFNTSSNLYFNGSIGIGVTAVSIGRAALGTYTASSVGIAQTLTTLNVNGTTALDMPGGSSLGTAVSTLYVSSSTGITTANYLLIDSELMNVTSVTGTTIGVTRAILGTVEASHADNSTVKVISALTGDTAAAVGISSTATTLQLTKVGNVSSGDYLLNPASSEIMSVTSVSNAGTVVPTAVTDWYNQQYILNTANGDNQTLLWKSVAARPKTNQYVAERYGSNDALHVVVVDSAKSTVGSGSPQQILEVFRNLSKATDTLISPSENVYYKNYISLNSQYVYAGEVLGTDSYWGITEIASAFSSGFTPVSTGSNTWGQIADSTKFNSVGNLSFTLTGGKDYSTAAGLSTNVGGFEVELNDLTSSMDRLADASTVQINYILQGGASGSVEFEQSKAIHLINIAEQRKDCLTFISPNRSAVVNVTQESAKLDNVLSFFTSLPSSSYAVFDSGYQYVYDRFNKDYVYIPCSSDIAGLCVRTDINNYSWYSPAGKSRGSLKNTIKLAYNPKQDHRDELYSNRVNPVITYPGSGTILFGDKTALSYPSAFDRINVRRLFIALETAIRGAADSQLFEFNDASTRASFINIVEPYLRDVQTKRGITDFLLVCDESNNTPAVIDRNEFVADIYVKPARSINYIGLTFVATRTGVSFESIVGTF